MACGSAPHSSQEYQATPSGPRHFWRPSLGPLGRAKQAATVSRDGRARIDGRDGQIPDTSAWDKESRPLSTGIEILAAWLSLPRLWPPGEARLTDSQGQEGRLQSKSQSPTRQDKTSAGIFFIPNQSSTLCSIFHSRREQPG